MDMKNSSVEFENNFAEDFYNLLQSVIQNDIKALAKSDKHFNDVTKQTIEYDISLTILIRIFSMMALRAEMDSDMQTYCKKLEELVLDLSSENLRELKQRLEKVRKGTE